MTETTGFEEFSEHGEEPDESQSAQPEPDESLAAEPVAEAEPAGTAEPAAGDETQASAAPAEAVSAPLGDVAMDVSDPPAPDPVPWPFIPDTGVADWLRNLLIDFHQRLRNAGF